MKKQKTVLLLATCFFMVCGGCSSSSTKNTVPDSKVEADLSEVVMDCYGHHSDVIEKIDVISIEHAPDTENHEDHIKAQINILMPYGESTWHLSNGRYIYFKSDDRWSGLAEKKEIEADTNIFSDRIKGHYDGYKELWIPGNQYKGYEYSIDVTNINFNDMTIELAGSMDDKLFQGSYSLQKDDGMRSGIHSKYIPSYYYEERLGNSIYGAIVISPCYGIEIKIKDNNLLVASWEAW